MTRAKQIEKNFGLRKYQEEGLQHVTNLMKHVIAFKQ